MFLEILSLDTFIKNYRLTFDLEETVPGNTSVMTVCTAVVCLYSSRVFVQ